jgi:hypothetical protein
MENFLVKELLIKAIDNIGLAWWVEIVTELPNCTYYFGPFLNEKEAEASQAGYVEDLESEGAQGIAIKIKRCKPSKLTVFEEGNQNGFKLPTLSGQFF